MADKTFTIQGVVVSSFTGVGMLGLKVEAWDKDRRIDDLLGSAVTDANGRFEITFDDSFQDEICEFRKPDVYFRVFQKDLLILSTEESVCWNVSRWPMQVKIPVDLALPVLQISASQLSLGMQGPDVARVQNAMRALGRTVPAAENGQLGPGSVAVVKALQADFGVPATGVVDLATVNAINVKLAERATAPRVVRGSVLDANRSPFTNGSVEAFAVTVSGKQSIGRSTLNSADGSYEITYRPPADSDGRVDLRVVVLDSRGGIVETTPSGASILANAGPLEVVDFIVNAVSKPPLSEFDLIRGDLLAPLGGRRFTDLVEDEDHHDVSLLAVQSGYAADQVAAMVLAHKLAVDTKSPAEMFYGLLRQGLPAEAAALHAAHPAVRRQALQDAVEQGIVPKTVGGKNIDAVLDEFKPTAPAEFKTLLRRTLNENEVGRFVGLYLQESQDPDTFWTKIATDDVLASRAAELKLTVQLAIVTGNHDPLVTALQARPDLKQASDLVRLTAEDWKSLVLTPDVGVPPGTPGSTPEAQTQSYVQQILRQVEAAFPTQFFAERLGSSPVAAFLKSQPYDLRRTYPEQFFQQHPDAARSLTAEQRGELSSFQRLHRLTSSAQETIALAAGGVRSAQQIARMDVTVFVEQQKDILSDERAHEVHARARQVSALALALYSEHSATLNRTAMAALPGLNAKAQADAASAIPDWETLFGSFDACACEHCASVHGPAAYLVDILQFLSERGVEQALFDRRPDLEEVELSCENATTAVPYIDLVNEILEQTVAPPAQFSPITLVPEFEADLNGTVATADLAAAFQPPLQTDARVEVLEAGSRWRLWDESFAYDIAKQDDSLNVVGRSRQTAGSSDERRATSQYRNRAAYAELSQAVYPWNLPFDLNSEEARVYLAHLGVTRAELIEALRPIPKPFDPNSPVVYRLAAERLGLTDVERKILTGETLSPPRQPEELCGSATVNALTTVQTLLDRSELTFAELEALLSTSVVNPDQTLTITTAPDAPVDTCDTTRLQVDGLSTDVLSRIHVFVRLWRKLGWTIWEVDRAVQALTSDPLAPAFTNELLVRLDHLRTLASQLRLSPVQTLALWKPIDTREPGSLYGSLFYNPAVFQPQHEDFRLRPDGRELLVTDQPLAEHALALQAALRLSSTEFERLVSRTDGMLNLANLSFLYRHATLARQLKLTVQDLLTAVDLTGIDPFNASQSQDSVFFVQTIKSIRAAGFSIAQLDYLLRNRAETSSALVPTEAYLAETLTALQSDLLKIKGDPDELAKEESAIVDRISTAIQLRADVTKDLLGRVMQAGKSALERFRELPLSGDPNNLPPLTREIAPAAFLTLEKLAKIALVIQTLKFPATQLDWLFREHSWLGDAPDVPASPVSLEDWYFLIQLQQVRRELGLEDAALEAILATMNAAAMAEDEAGQKAAKRDFADALATWLDWPLAILQTLLGNSDDLADRGLLDAQMPADYRSPELLLRLQRAVRLVTRLGVSAELASQWCEASLADADATAIRGAAKAKYDNQAWRKVATPLQDSLRDRQREALVSFLVARPETWNVNGGVGDVNDLYGRLLIDVEMSSCQLTSRLVQATGSVQLFVQRCLMGLEPDIQMTDPKWQQWRWMKNYRVWEANRKVWLYPENWIEPELRDGKSPFFQDLENELLQSDLDNAAAEQALMRYLEKLDEVSLLEIAGTYQDDEDQVLHVFGRTFHTPRIYYYRRREGATLAWTPWEKMDVDIEGDHLIPVMWNRKLLLVWPIFTEKQDEEPVVMPPPGDKLEGGTRYWEIQLAWSEFQYGRWTGKNLSEPVRFEGVLGQPDILFGERTASPVLTMARLANDKVPDVDDGGFDPPGSPTPGAGSPTGTSQSELPRVVPKNLISFKALVAGDSLTVRGYLRLDYGGSHPQVNSGIAFPFGEFRFYGCRKIVATAHLSQMANKNFALAPKDTRFDGMWFAGTGSGLKLLDGTFPSWPKFVFPTALTEVNEPQPLPTDASSTVVNRIDVPVLDGAASAFRLLVPHQDLQFVGDRPCFYIDAQRTFMVSSTGNSGVRTNLHDWVVGDLATIGLATASQPAGGDSGNGSPASIGTFTLLVPGRNGKRVARTLTRFDLKPVPVARTIIPTFWTTREYAFQNAHHPYVCEFVKRLNSTGIDGLLSLETQRLHDEQSFDVYKPTAHVKQNYPVDAVEFQSGGAYDLYNWELFFHIPLLIATRLRTNQRFEEAQRWLHYIFDPTGVAGGDIPQRYWRMLPFHNRLSGDYEKESAEFLERLAADGTPDDLEVAVAVWREKPFSPHAIARLRTTAYQKTVVMKYIDNLIAWGDQLFRRDTLESINEATQLYVLAAEILGRRPEVIQRNLRPRIKTFNTLASRLGVLSNALEQIELLIPTLDAAVSPPSNGQQPDPPSSGILYFCVPENEQLVAYWNTVADRLFKIRHCMNIEGQVRQLPLFEPPIDPALLVRAQAAGLSISDVLSDVSAPLPNYRFSVMLQKANELVAEVRNLGGALLSAWEKRDAEAISTLRSGQELRLLQAVRDIRKQQIDEAEASIDALNASRQVVQARKDYYESRERLSTLETTSLLLLGASVVPIEIGAHLRVLAGLMQKFGSTKFGSPTTAGFEVGGYFVGVSVEEAAIALDAASSIMNISSQVIGRMGDYTRRQDEWDHQANLATIELKQIDQQLAAANIRLAIAQQELRNHDQQIDNAREVDQFLRTKFTNQDLHQWTIGQVSGLYFQSYQLAYDLAKRAEKCLRFELGLPDSSYIRFGYWDSLKKGLLSGEKLQYDLRRLESAYLEQNRREFELTKHVSLAQVDPIALLKLRQNGECFVDIPETVFDMDYPGHYFRRIKTVGLSIPCVTGPYTTLACTLTLTSNQLRKDATLLAGKYARDTAIDDPRFRDEIAAIQSIATSSARNDSGMFELNFRDERYLPFEAAGAISSWRIKLNKDLQQFDFSTISDVILHLNFTAREGGELLRSKAVEEFNKRMNDLALAENRRGLYRVFDLKREDSGKWNRFLHPATPNEDQELLLDDLPDRLPYFTRQFTTKKVRQIEVAALMKDGDSYEVMLSPLGATPGDLLSLSPDATYEGLHHASKDLTGSEIDFGEWTFKLKLDGAADFKSLPADTVKELFLIINYTIA